MLEEGYFKANRDSVLQLIRRHTAETVKRNTKLEDYLNGKLQTQMQSNELFGLTKFLSTLRDLSQANIQQAEQLRADSLAEKRLDLRYIEAEIDSNLLEIQELEDLINELEALAAFVSPDYVEVDFSTLPIELQKEAEALITSLGSEVEEVNFYSNTSVPGVTEYIVSITKTDGKVLIISHVNGKLLPAIEGFNLGIAMSMIFGRKDILSEQKEILALRNEKLAELENSRIKTEDDIALLKTFDFTQNSEEFHMANLSEEDLPAAVKDFLIKKDIEKGKEVLKTETENFSNGIYSVTVLKKMIDYLNLLLKYPSLGANEPEVLQLLADLTTLFNAVDAAFKKQIAEGKKFMDEHENSITEYLNEFSSDPNNPVFIEILTELKRLRDVATNPASDPNDAQLAKDKIAQKLIALNELIHTSVFSDIIEELHDFLIPRGASIDEALTEILTRKSTSAKPLTSAERKDTNKNLLSYHSSYRFFQGLIKGIPFLNTYLISDRIDFKEFEQLVNSMTINDIEFTTVPSQAEFDAFKAKLLAFFNEYRKLRKIEKAINFLNSGVDLTELYKNAPMPTVFPSPQQQVVMEEALAYLTKGRTKEAFVIDGAAGTGKTFLLNQFLGTTKVLTWSPYQHADENLKQTLNVETALGTVEDLIKEVLPSSVSSRDIEGKFDHVKEKVDKILADKAHPLYNMVSQLQIGMPLVVDEIYAADIDTQIVLTALAKDFGAKVILLGDPNQIANLHGLAKYSWGFVTAYTRHATPLSVRFRSFVLPIAATQEAFYGKTSAITEIHTSHNDELGVKGFNDASDLLSDIKTKLKNGVPAADCKVIVSKDLVATYKNEFRNQGIAVEVLSVEESQGREFPYVWVDITKINVNGIVQETAHNKLVYTAVSRGKKYIGYNNAKGSSVDTRTQIISSFDASLTEDTDFKNLLFAANEKTYLELLQRRNAPSSRPIPVLPSLGSPIVPPTVVPLPTTPTVPVTPQRTSLLNSALNKGKIVLNFLKKLKTVIANKINNQTPPPATNNTTTNPPPNNQTTPVPPTTNIPVTNTPIPPTTNTPVPPTTSNQSEIEAKKADIERRRQEDLKNIKPTSTPNNISNFPLLKGTDVVRYIPESIAKKAWEYWDRVFDTGQTLQRAKERGGFGVSEMNEFYPNWKNELPEAKEINAKYDAELKALEQSLKETTKTETTSNQSEIEAKKADIERRRQEELNKANKQIEKTNKKEDRRLKVETYRTLDIGGNPVEVEITTNADGSRLLRARQVNEDGSIEPMAYATERINNKSQATLTNEKLIEGYIGNEDNTLQRTNVDENPNQTHIDKINAKYDAELAALEGNKSTTNDEYKLDYLINKTPIKAGVEELFDSNPELANQVYESLGFNKNVDLSLSLLTTTEKILNGTNKKLNYSSNDIITGEETLKEIKGNFNIKHDAGSRFDLYKGDTKIANFKIVTDENDFIIDDISTVRNIRRQGVITFLIRALSRSNEMKHGKTLKIRTNILKQDGKSLLDSLEKKGIGFYTTDDLFQISPTNLFAQITTQQKQQALQLYSQYLDTIFPDSKVEEMDDNLYISVLNQLEQENIIEKDCSGGKLKAKDGLKTTFTKGGKWKIIKDLKGYPTHKEGGVDLTIGKDGVNIKNGNIQFTAKHGLVISAIKAQEGLVETLPVASQYAGDGSLLPDWDKVKTTLNPYNWGVPDYTDKGDFNTAYSTARKEGKEEFLFNGKRYNTDYKGTPQQQLKETGLTNEQITGNKTLKKVYKNTTPYTSILPPLIQGLKGFAGFEDKNRDINVENPIPIAYYLENNQKVFRDLPEEEQKKYKELSKPYFKRADDAWALYTGNPQRFKTFEISNHKPSNSKNKDDYYYSLNKSYPELLEFIEKEGMDLKPGESKQVEEPTKLMLRNFKIGKGKDERGDYISYYDNWNLNPSLEFPIPEQGKPFEIYDRIYIKDYGDGKQKRMYYTDKELLELNLDKKDFDTLALQRELSNRGYELPKSTKSDGSFDGMWGDETKNALLEYRKSQTK